MSNVLRAVVPFLAVVIALLAPRPAASAVADIGSLSSVQRSALPDGTLVTLNGKTTTLGSLRTIHAALLAHFQAIGTNRSISFSPARLITQKVVDGRSITVGAQSTENVGQGQSITVGGQRTESVGAGQTIQVGAQRTETVSGGPPAGYSHVASAVTTGPIDYLAACSKITVCVYLPPGNLWNIWTSTKVTVVDALLSPDVCKEDGGAFQASACYLNYPTTAQQSAFPGNPPAMQAAVSCPTTAGYSTTIDPLGAAQITMPNVAQSAGGTTCAINLYVPS